MKTRTSKPKPRVKAARSRTPTKWSPPWTEEEAGKRLDELAREQGIGDRIPDYATLASKVWPTPKDVEEFDQWLSEIRRKGTAAADIDD